MMLDMVIVGYACVDSRASIRGGGFKIDGA